MTESDKAVMQQILEAIQDFHAGWGYIRATYGDLYGVGWNRAEIKGLAAIALIESVIAQPIQEPAINESDFIESVGLMLASVGYTEDYTCHWPKEKVSITFKRWFDAQMENAKMAQPTHPHDLQKRFADLHQYEEIAEHYAKCAISPEALRDWVADRMNVDVVEIDAATQKAIDKAITNWEIKLCTDAIKQGNVTIRKPLK